MIYEIQRSQNKLIDMQQVFMKKLFIASIALLAVPAVVLAQKEKEEKDAKEKKEMQQIIITRSATAEGKTVIEIDGDKVKINGKDIKDEKDVSVHVNKFKGANVFRWNEGQNSWNFGNDHLSLFTEDENRAMLGVVTEGHDKGAEIKSITKDSGAEKAGLKKGDVITKIGEKQIEDTDDVTKAIRAQKPGEKIAITYLRDGKEQKVTAELGKWKGLNIHEMALPRFDQFSTAAPPEIPSMTYGNGNGFGGVYFGNRPRLGLSIQDTEDGKGVKVLEVDEEGNAAKAGIQENDVILFVDDKEIKGTDDVTKIIRDNKEKYTFNFKVQRNGKTQTIEVKMPKKLKTTDL